MYRFFLISAFFLASCGNTVYVVRHAEKAAPNNQMSSDVPLSQEGKERAIALRETLKDKNIRKVYSTNYIRTKATAEPLATSGNIQVELYQPNDSLFVNKIRQIKKDNVLVVGHSNTVDNIINGIIGIHMLDDLPDSQYGDLFILKRKGNKYVFSKERFGGEKIKN